MIILQALLLLVCQLEFDGQVVEPPLDDGSTLELSLKDALATAIANNLSLKTTRLDTDAAIEGFRAAWGEFDSVFFVDATRQVNNQPPSPVNFVGGVNLGSNPASEFDTTMLRTGVRGMFTTGTTWQLDVGNTDFKRTITGVPGHSDSYTADWRLSMTHPLLRGGSDDYAMTGVVLAAHDVRITALSGEDSANDILQSVIQAYWNLVFAQQDVETRELSVQLANELLEITQRKFAQGLQNRINVIEAEAELARRREELLTARNSLLQNTDDLFSKVFAPSTMEGWHGTVVPVTDYTALPDNVRSLEAALAIALTRRPDIRNAKVTVARADIDVRRARNQALHRLDVTGTVGINSEETNVGRSYQTLFDRRRHLSALTLNYELPIGNRNAGYTLRRRQVELERSKVALHDTEMKAIAEVRQEERNVALQRERVVATAETTRLRREVYEGEKRRLENALSTAFEVREDQRDLLEAIDSETRARLDLATALTSYKAAQGDLLSLLGYDLSTEELDLEEAPPAP